MKKKQEIVLWCITPIAPILISITSFIVAYYFYKILSFMFLILPSAVYYPIVVFGETILPHYTLGITLIESSCWIAPRGKIKVAITFFIALMFFSVVIATLSIAFKINTTRTILSIIGGIIGSASGIKHVRYKHNTNRNQFSSEPSSLFEDM